MSSNSTRTARGACASTAPFAGLIAISVACAAALAGRASAASKTRTAAGALHLRRGYPARLPRGLAASLARPVPIYEYKCPNGHLFEVFHGMTEPGPTACEVCGASPLQGVLHPVAVHYKGSGFYSTDYGRKSKQPAAKDGGGSVRLLVGLLLVVVQIVVGQLVERGLEEDHRGVTVLALLRTT